MDQNQEKQTKCSLSFYTFSQETSLHGIKKASDKEYPVYRRTLWWLILLSMTGAFLYTLVRGLRLYLSYPTTVNIRVEPTTEIPFPAVTVCNNNQIRKSFIDADPVARKWFDVYQPVYGKRRVPANLSEDLQHWLNTTDAPTYYRNGAPIKDKLIYDCEYQRQHPVNCADIVRPTFTLEGLCYTLSPHVTTRDAGYAYGLSFKVHIDQDEYDVHSSSEGFGVKLMIHEEGVHPASSLINLEPGKEVHIAMNPTKTIWKNAPYNPEGCVEFSSRGYSKGGCLIGCSFMYYTDHVGCDFTGDNDNLRNCTMFERVTFAFEAYSHGIRRGVFANGSSCGCGVPCEQSLYSTHLSSMGYPSDFVVSHLKLNMTPSFLAKNIIFVNVYFEDLNVVVTEQVASYSFQSLLSDVGGLMGLCLGASVITISEILELFLVLLAQSVKCRQNSTEQD